MERRRQRAPGERSRRRILDQAARLATIEGLEGLSIGRLAEATGMPKSSVYVLFGSKEELQVATIEAARVSFVEEVVSPALRSGRPGGERLAALCEGFLSYVERRVFPGGCFFVATAAELGARPGRVHDRVAAYQRDWRELLEQTAREAGQAGELPAGTDPAQLAFELSAILAGTNIVAVLHDDDTAIDHARRAIAARLAAGRSGVPSVAHWTRPGSRAEDGASVGWFERPEFGANVGLIDEIYRQYLDNPESVSPAWRDFFAENEPGDDGAEAAAEADGRGTGRGRGRRAPQAAAAPPTPRRRRQPRNRRPRNPPPKTRQAGSQAGRQGRGEARAQAGRPRGTGRPSRSWCRCGGRRPGSWRRWRPAGRCRPRPRSGPCRRGCWRSTAASSTGTCAGARAARSASPT